jgi:DMSO reductase anchor subunit
MHPAYSVILFTTASGAGFGLLIWLALAALAGLAWSSSYVMAAFGLAFLLTVAGLMSSTFHLGRPERAWRAFSQWQTSWLSREGVAAVVTLGAAGLLALAAIAGAPSLIQKLLAIITVVSAVATVWCTGMIYQSLPTIPAWNKPSVSWIYLLLALASGLLLLYVVDLAFDRASSEVALYVIALTIAAGAAKWLYWQSIDTTPPRFDAGQATGLGRFGRVRPLDPPHTQANYIMREMGYAIARKHAARLRLIALGLMAGVPAVLLLAGLSAAPTLSLALAIAAAVSMAAGLVTERWLFFAEAKHVVMLYYGAEKA